MIYTARVDWAFLKSVQATKRIPLQYTEDATSYYIYLIDNNYTIHCRIFTTSVNADRTDFEDNYKANCNTNITPTDANGSPLTRTKVTQSGWNYQLHSLEFSTSKRSITYSKDVSGSDLSFCTLKSYDVNGAEITADENLINATKTVLSWEPTFNYEIAGAFLYQSAKPNTNVRLWVVGVPDVAEGSGGSKAFVQGGVNLKFLPLENALRVDGRAPKLLTYDATAHTNLMRLTFQHDAGMTHDMMLVFEIFKA